MSKKEDFLVVYDYGSGGVWLVIHARSRDEITEKYRDLNVFDSRPDWMTDEEYHRIERSSLSCDIDTPTDWLLRFSKIGEL